MKKSLIFLLLFVLTLALCFTVPGVAAVAEEGIAYNEMQSVTTGLINPATTVTEIKSSADINKAVSSKANVVLVDFDAGLNVTAEDGFYVGSGINATVSGCTVNATDKAFLVYGNLSSVGNTVESSKRSFWIEGGSVDVESGTYNASSTCVYVLNGSVANIYGGRYIAPNNTYVLSTNGGTLNVYGGQFSCASSEAMVNSTNGALKFKLYSGASFGSLFPNGISANVALSSLACTGAAF